MASNTVREMTSNKTAVRKRLQFRDTRQGVVPNTIDALNRLTIDAATKAALTTAGAKLTVEIDTAGTRVFLADQRTGQLIGGPEDLTRLGGIRSFVNREKKESHGQEVADEVTQLAYKCMLECTRMNPEYKQGPLENSFGASVRPLLSVVAAVDGNLRKLSENTNPEGRSTFEPILKGFMVKIRNAYFTMAVRQTNGTALKGMLNDILFDYGVPEYVHSKLANPNLVLDRAQVLGRVLFPSDPSKGLSLTLKEWRSGEFRKKLGTPLLVMSTLVVNLAMNDKFLRTITKIDSSVSLNDETNPSVAKLLKCRLAVMPSYKDCRYVIEPASKARAGWKFPSPGMDSIQGAITTLSTAMLRVYSANLQSVDLVGDYYSTIAPGSVSRAAVTPTNNFYVQWGNAPEPNQVWAEHVLGGLTGIARQNVWRWLRMEMRLSENAQGGQALAESLRLNSDGTPLDDIKREIEIEIPDPKDPSNKITEKKTVAQYPSLASATSSRGSFSLAESAKLNLLRDLTAAEVPLWQEWSKRIFPSKNGKKKKSAPMGVTLTKLTPQARELLEEVGKLSDFLKDRMATWLRGFSDERIQRAAVKLAVANFDELFLQDDNPDENESDDDDSSDDEE